MTSGVTEPDTGLMTAGSAGSTTVTPRARMTSLGLGLGVCGLGGGGLQSPGIVVSSSLVAGAHVKSFKPKRLVRTPDVECLGQSMNGRG